MKPRVQINKLGSPKVAFGKDEEPRGHNGGMKKGKKETLKS